jgi:hypothetical protein
MPEVFEVHGIAVYLNPAPPVYAPGGPVGFAPELPEGTSSQIVASLESEAAKRGAVLLVIQCPSSAKEREAMLRSAGYAFASSWYLGRPSQQTTSDSSLTIRPAAASDVPRLLEIREKKFEQYETFSPVFWKKAPIPREEFGPFITSQVESETNIALIAEQDGVMRGYIIAQCRNPAQGGVDDYAVAAPETDWPIAGVALLAEAGRLAQIRNVSTLTVVTGHADLPKRAAIESLGYVLQRNWMVKSLKS